MDIETIKQKKSALETSIAVSLRKFIDDTGVNITSVDVQAVDVTTLASKTSRYYMEVHIRVDI